VRLTVRRGWRAFKRQGRVGQVPAAADAQELRARAGRVPRHTKKLFAARRSFRKRNPLLVIHKIRTFHSQKETFTDAVYYLL